MYDTRIRRVAMVSFFFQAEDGIRDLVRSRGLGDVYKRQLVNKVKEVQEELRLEKLKNKSGAPGGGGSSQRRDCLLYTSDAADERSSVDLGGRRIIKKKKNIR